MSLCFYFYLLNYFDLFQRHAMVHEALRDEMLKREAGCAIDIHVSNASVRETLNIL